MEVRLFCLFCEDNDIIVIWFERFWLRIYKRSEDESFLIKGDIIFGFGK